jgi:segregation and condensation protein B
MNENELKLILEALLLSANRPLKISEILATFEEWEMPTTLQIKKSLSLLANDYAERAVEVKEVANGYCILTKPQYKGWVSKMLAEKPVKYSKAVLETLAIIAYKQPVTRAEIEDIRGVAVSSSMLKSLLEREWVRVAGFRDVPGKPALYITTSYFLDYFNLKTLDELPTLINSVEASLQGDVTENINLNLVAEHAS